MPRLHWRLSERSQDLIAHLDRWADLAFPIATALLLIGQLSAANTLLFLWLLGRLTLFSEHKQPHNWILASLAMVNFGTIVFDQGGKPSDPSDLLLIALAFAAGLNRPLKNWIRSARLITLCLAPIALKAITAAGTDTLLEFPDINVNRLSFLLGLLSISGYACFRWGQTRSSRLGWASLTLLILPLGFLTGSRAALAAPILSIGLTWLMCSFQIITKPRRRPKRPGISIGLVLAAIAATSLGLPRFWYSNPETSSENIVSDKMRLATATCWIKAPIERGKAWEGLGFNKTRRHCDADNIPYLRRVRHEKGLPHAHNIFSQITAETGIPGLAALLGFILWAGQSLFSQLKRFQGNKYGIVALSLPLFIYLGLTGMTTSFYVYLMLNQVLIGYLLGSLLADNEDSEPIPTQRNGC
jgi:hypothetical protein